MKKFSLAIKNPSPSKKKWSIALLHFTAAFLLVDAWFESNINTYIPWLGILFLIVAFVEVIYTFFAFRLMSRYPLLNSVVRLITGSAFLVYAILLLYEGQVIFGVFMLLIAGAFVMIYFIEKRWAKPFIVQANEQGILFPGTFKTPLIPWRNFNHIILRDDLLTLDLTSNRVIQLELQAGIDEQEVSEFNAYCSQKIG